MNKRVRALALAGLLAVSLVGNALAMQVQPSTTQITVSENAKTLSFSLYVTAKNPYIGAEFALGTSSNALQFDSITYADGLLNTHETVQDDVLHFGYFASDNTHAPDHTHVATLTYRYAGSVNCAIDLLSAELHVADGKTLLTDNVESPFTVRISREEEDRRPSTGGSNTNKPEKDEVEETPEETPEELPEEPDKKPITFQDTTNHWAKDAIHTMVERGLFNGMSETNFGTEASITRGMFVTVLGRLAQAEHPGNSKFADVPSDAYYANYVAWAYENGIVNGVSAEHFAPNTPITREQMAVMLANYAKFAEKTLEQAQVGTDFTDGHAISSWADDAVRALQMAGVLNGRDTGAFDPTATATRAEAATVFMRFSDLL